MKKVIIVGVIIVFVGLIIIANLKKKSGVEVTVQKIDRGDITEVVTGSGKIYPVVEVKISANVAGEIKKLTVDEGDEVKKGQLLVLLDQERYKANVNQAESGILSAKANYRIAKLEFDRIKELYEKKLVSSAEFESAQAKLEQAESQLKQAEAVLNEAKDALSKTVIKSPIDGVVIEKRKEEGEIALGSQFQADVILTIGDLNDIEARVEVNENDIPRVKIGDSVDVNIDAFPDRVFKGVVTKISYSPVIQGLGTQDEVTNYLVYVKLLELIPEFRTGMSCSADIKTETHKNVIRVPIQAVTTRVIKNDQDKKPKEVVFKLEEDHVVQVPVELGISDDDYYEVTKGISVGDLVVTGPFRVVSQVLQDGMKVKVKKEESNKKKETK